MRERYLRFGLVIICIFTLLISCGGSSTESGGDSGSRTASITLSADPVDGIPADGSSSAAITAELKDGSGEAVAQGTSVTFSTTLGIFQNDAISYTVSTMDDSGTVVVSLRSTIPGPATVTASSGGATQAVTVEFGNSTASIILSADPAEGIPADGSSSAAITAELKDGSGEAVAQGTSVTFSTTSGFFSNSNGSTSLTVSTVGDSGKAVVSLSSTTSGPATVTASSGGATQQVTVVFSDVPASLSLESSKTTVKSDDSDSATITAVVRAHSSAVIEGVTVSFGATDGGISASHAVTDAAGKAIVNFSSGEDKENHYVSISASVFGIEEPRYVNVEITGTTVDLSANTTNIEVGASAVHLNVTVSDAGGTGIYDAPVILTASPAGKVSLQEYSGNTDFNGRLDVEVSGTASGNVTVTAQSLGAEASQNFVVGEAGFVFGITSPEEDPASLYTGSNLPIVVNAPDQVNVLFVTTVGTLTGAGGTGRVITEPVSGGAASAVLSSDVAGVATVRVMDAADPSTSDSLKVDIYPPVSESSQIALQANPTVIETNAGDINTATLVATVKNADDQIIKGAPVAFSMKRATGGGEFISPSMAYTNNEGKATATFTSGSLSSDANGVEICAEVAGMPAAGESCVSIIIGGTAGAVMITQGSVIESVSNDTAYKLPMSVLVTDSDGSPVKGTPVSLGVWPPRCASGYWFEVEPDKCEPLYECVLTNEDENRNLTLDPGEDRNGDGSLTPPISAAGAIPPYVTTDEDGVAEFYLIYLKSSAAWVETEVTATTYVLGTETKSTYTFWLPYLEDEACHLPHSPYNTKSVSLLSAVPSTLAADGSSTSAVTALVTDALNRPADGDTVMFTVTSGTGTVNPTFVVTVGGIAGTTYTASLTPGTETVKAEVLGSECASATVNITLTTAEFPTADFAAVDLNDEDHVLFTDASSPSPVTGAAIDTWSWTFKRANGTVIGTSTAQNPGSISLGSAGSYVVTLTVTDALGAQDTMMKAVTVESQIVSPTAPTADFTASDLGDRQHVLFTDNSTAKAGTTIASWLWTFKNTDGTDAATSSSSLQNPGGVKLADPAVDVDTNYIVSLTVTNNLGESDTEMKVVEVKTETAPVSPTAPTADFDWAPLGDAAFHVLFTDTSTAASGTSITDWDWTFKKAIRTTITVLGTSDKPNPLFSFPDAGGYIVSLTVTNNLTEPDTVTKVITVPAVPDS